MKMTTITLTLCGKKGNLFIFYLIVLHIHLMDFCVLLLIHKLFDFLINLERVFVLIFAKS